jgi:hypothetical protein
MPETSRRSVQPPRITERFSIAATKSITLPPARRPFFLQESEWQYHADFASLA